MDQQDKIDLLRQHLQGTLGETAMRQWVEWMQETSLEEFNAIAAQVNDAYTTRSTMPKQFQEQLEAKVDALEREEQETETLARPVHRVHFLRTAWFRYAAAILIIFGIGSYLYITNQSEKPSVTQQSNPSPVKNDVAPGGNKATLTLADGKKIVLDSAKSGEIAAQSGAVVVKNDEGKIEYKARGDKGVSIAYNTMSTPRGGQYQLTLPDGSQVWLNAESSITYPTAFVGNERKVSITGEAYFEVAKDKTKKFMVNVNDKAEVEVLGTHFNINGYKEEPTINTTLLEGSVRLTSTSVHTSLILKPGQQGQLQQQRLSLAANPDVDQVMAWKNGMFQYERTDIHSIMRQVERWYDVEVVYENNIENVDFTGGIARSETVSKLLVMLEKTGAIHFRIEGKKIFVSK